MPVNAEETRLKRRVTFLGLLAMSVGVNIGGALFALTGTAADLAGPALPISMAISAVPVLLAVVPYGVMTSVWPTTSASYRYIQLFSARLAIVTLLTLVVCILIGGQPLFALAFGLYLKELYPLEPIMTGAAILTIFYVVNLLGINITAKIQSVLFIILIAALGIFIFQGIDYIEPGNFKDLFSHGIGNTIAAAGLLYTFCAGGFFIIELGNEVIQARRTYPRVLLTGMIMVVILYMAIHVITIGVFKVDAIKGVSLISVAESFMNRTLLYFFIIGGALVACATTINIVFSIISRGILVAAQEGVIPSFLGHVNSKFGTPHWSLTFSYVISMLSLIGIPSLIFFGSMLNLGIILAITMVVVSCYRVSMDYKKILRRSSIKVSPSFFRIICFAIIIFNSGIFIFFVLARLKSALVFAGILMVTVIFSIIRRTFLKEIHFSIQKRFLKDFIHENE